MVWPFSGKKAKSGFEKMQERDQMLKDIQKDARDGNSLGLYSRLNNLVSAGFLEDSVSWQVLGGVVDILAQPQPREGLAVVIWLLPRAEAEETKRAIADKAFSLIEKTKSTDPQVIATAAMTCLVITTAMPAGSDGEKKARALWHQSVDKLAKTGSGVNFAFAAASNAILSRESNSPLKAEALKKWEEIVVGLAKENKPAALAEAARVAAGYTNFGMDALPFRQKAIQILYGLPR